MSGLVELGRYSDASLAHILQARLESAGIHAVCFDSGMNTVEGVPMLIRVRLMVLDEDLEEARTLLNQHLAEAQEVFGDDIFAGEVFDEDAWASDGPSDLAQRRSRLLMWGAVLLVSTFLVPLVIAGLSS